MSAMEGRTAESIVERRRVDNLCQEFCWGPVDVVQGITVESDVEWNLLWEESDWVQTFTDEHHVHSPFQQHEQKKAHNLSKGGLRPQPIIDRTDGGRGQNGN